MGQQGGGSGAAAPVDRAVSFAQQRLWFLDQLRPGSVDHLLPLALRIRGDLDVGALLGAFEAVVQRHEILRTRYVAVDGEPVQRVDPTAKVVPDLIDLTECVPSDQASDRTAVVTDLVRRELNRPVDLSVAPLRAVLARLAADDHLLVVVMHHIAFDGRSWQVLGRELAAGYGERVGGAPAHLPALPVQYADFAEWQREQLAGPRLQRQLGFWRDRLAGLAPLRLPADRPRPATWDSAGDVSWFQLPADVVAAVDAFARQRRCTRFMVLLAAFQALLAHHSGQTDIAVGTPVAGRTRPEVESLIGMFVNTVVLRADVSGDPSFDEVLRRSRTSALTALSHADAPFERIVNELAPERDLSRNPLFQVAFTLIDVAAEELRLPGLDVELVRTPITASEFDLTLMLKAYPDGHVDGRLEYATALFDADTMACLGAGYRRLLADVLAEPDVPVRELARRLDPLPARERRRLLAQWNDTARPMPDGTVVDLIERQVRATPDATALVSAGTSLSYAELDARVNRLAHHLRGLGVGRGGLVAVRLRRGADLLVAFLAVLKAGGAYVPIDPEYPAERIAFLVGDSGAQVVVSTSDLTDPAGPRTAETSAARQVLLDRDSAAIAAQPAEPPTGRPALDDIAYVIYTSGSTGRPKGVMVHHRALTNFLLSMAERPGLAAGKAVLALTTVSFDPSALEMYLPLVVGARVVMADTEQARDPQRMVELIAASRPHVVQATPTVLRLLVETGWQAPAGLTVLSGGEKLPVDLARKLAAGGAAVWDLYGPTETTVWVSTARLDRDGVAVEWAATDNTTVRLLDRNLEPVPDGEVGEMFVGGTCVTLGYRGRPDLTATTFLPDPHATEPGARLYRTGDLARRLPGGAVEILGRGDHQVKIRGHRMEPGEIEAALLDHPDVSAAVVHPTPTRSGELQLTAYLVTRDGGPLPLADLRALVLLRLPDYMLPAAYVRLDAVPRTPSGKVDRTALPMPEESAGPVADAPRVAPRTPDERTIAEVWQEVLGRPAVGAYDDFFAIGGHSLLATRVAVRLRAALGVDVPVRALFDHTTVAALATALPGYPRVAERPALPVLGPRRSNRRQSTVPVAG